MSERKRDSMRGVRFPLHARFYTAGIIILIMGLVSAVFIYMSAASNGDLDYDLSDTKLYQFQLEKIGGKSAILGVQLTHWVSSLWHGKPLAFTVAILSIVAAIILFLLGNRYDRTEE